MNELFIRSFLYNLEKISKDEKSSWKKKALIGAGIAAPTIGLAISGKKIKNLKGSIEDLRKIITKQLRGDFPTKLCLR